jgi:hypothetical protein
MPGFYLFQGRWEYYFPQEGEDINFHAKLTFKPFKIIFTYHPCKQTKWVTMSWNVIKLVTVNSDSIRPCWEGFNLDFKKREIWSCMINSKTGKIIENSYWPVISNRGSFSFFEDRDNTAFFHKLGKVF